MEWISVKDRLPEKNVTCLVYTNWEEICIGSLYAVGEQIGCWYIEDHCVREEVTHWMPLPEPPKE